MTKQESRRVLEALGIINMVQREMASLSEELTKVKEGILDMVHVTTHTKKSLYPVIQSSGVDDEL